MPRVIAVVGPTASGKTAAAIDNARAVRGEIVNADSRQVYAGMEIGTAAPGPTERAAVPHHLFTYLEPNAPFNLALYREAALAVLRDCWDRDVIPVLVGGTGQYTWGLLEGWSIPPVAPNEKLRASLFAIAESEGWEVLHRRLEVVDPIAADRIDGRNVRRVVRALEVFHQTGRPMSEWQTRTGGGFEWLAIGLTLPRAELDARIEQRVDQMFALGFVEEVAALRAAGFGRDLPSMSSIGYAQVHAYLDGEWSLGDAIAATKQATRRLARRQGAWFREGDSRIHWVESSEAAVQAAKDWLGGD